MIRRAALVTLGLALAVLATSAAEAPAQGLAKVRVGWNYHMGNSPALIASERGLFKKHGVDVELKPYASGPALTQAMATKEVDIAYVGFAPALGWLDRDIKTVAVAKSSWGLASVLVRTDGGINGLADLKGKTIAGSRKGSGNDILLRAFLLKELGKLDPDRDTQIVALSAEDNASVLKEKKVDAAMTVEPFTSALLAAEDVKAIVHTSEAAPKHPWYLVVTRGDFLDTQRDAVVRVVRAHVEAVKLLNSGPNEGAETIAKAFKLSPVKGTVSDKTVTPAEQVRQARQRVGFDHAVTDKDMEFFDRQVAWARSLGAIKGPHKAVELFDQSVLRDALK